MKVSSEIEEAMSRADPGLTPSSADDLGETPRFVLHKHGAERPFFALRFEVGGWLQSWSVPDGPATDPSRKRDAFPLPDLGLDYVDFEGVIPEGEYGAGPVLIWDAGTYRNLRSETDPSEIPMAQAVAEGRIVVWLEGKRLIGGFELVRGVDTGDTEQWTLTKMEGAGASVRREVTDVETTSVLTGRTLAEIAAQEVG
jgi:DNA ligase D-like protein (predicted 3'-phosphoesterase)